MTARVVVVLVTALTAWTTPAFAGDGSLDEPNTPVDFRTEPGQPPSTAPPPSLGSLEEFSAGEWESAGEHARRLQDAGFDSRPRQATTIVEAGSPDFSVGITEMITLGTEVSTKRAVTSVTMAPLYPVAVRADQDAIGKQLITRGTQFKLGYDADKKRSTVGLLLRVDPRWLAPDAGVKLYPAFARGESCALAQIVRRSVAGDVLRIQNWLALPSPPHRDYALMLSAVRSDLVDLADSAARHARYADTASAARAAVKGLDTAGGKPAEVLRVLRDFGSSLDSGSASKELTCSPNADISTIYRGYIRKLLKQPSYVLPSTSLGYQTALVGADLETDSDQRVDVAHTMTLAFSWRLSVFVEVDPSFTLSWTRLGSVEDASTTVQELHPSSSSGAKLAAAVVIPQLVGTKPFDSHYVRSGFQRGLALGIRLERARCTERSPSNCARTAADQEPTLSAASVLGTIELRLTSKVRPKINVGWSQITRQGSDPQDAGAKKGGFDISTTLLLSL